MRYFCVLLDSVNITAFLAPPSRSFFSKPFCRAIKRLSPFALVVIFSASTAGAVKFYGCQFNEPTFETLEETRLSGPEAIKDLPSNQGKVFVSHPVLDGYPEGTTFVYRSANMYGDRAAARMNTNLLVFAQKHFENKENYPQHFPTIWLVFRLPHWGCSIEKYIRLKKL